MTTIYRSVYWQTRQTRVPYGMSPRISGASGTTHQPTVSLSLPVRGPEARFRLRRVPVGSFSVAAGAMSSGQSIDLDSTVLVPNVVFLMVQLVSTSQGRRLIVNRQRSHVSLDRSAG